MCVLLTNTFFTCDSVLRYPLHTTAFNVCVSANDSLDRNCEPFYVFYLNGDDDENFHHHHLF